MDGSETKATWQELYQATLLEKDEAAFPLRLQAVSEAIAERLRDIARSAEGSSAIHERDSIADAIAMLRTVAKQRAQAPD